MSQPEHPNHPRRQARRRAGPLLAVFLVVAGTVGAFAPITPSVRAEDATPTPTAEPTPEPTAEPTPKPTEEPTPNPTEEPTPEPTAEATAEPTSEPTAEPTAEPTPGPTDDPGVEPTPAPTVEPSPEPSAEPTPTPEPQGPQVQHAWVDTVDDTGRIVDPGELDEPLTGAARFTVYHVRFQVVNHDDVEAVVHPVLELATGDGWAPLPMVDPDVGLPFYGASDDGRGFTPRRDSIAVPDLRLDDPADPAAQPVPGLHSSGRPLGALTLPPHSYTEIEVAVRATVDAAWGTGYRLRLVDGGAALDGAAPAEIVMGVKPEVDLSAGQQDGRGVKDPVPLFPLDPDVAFTDLPNGGVATAASYAQYNLRGPLAATGSPVSPHLIEGLASDACAACHSAHEAQGPMLLQQPSPQSGLCFTCHDGTGALSDVAGDWTDPDLPENDPSTGAWYSHPATATDGHVNGIEDEFGGVLDRHAVCADCHQPHLSDGSRGTPTTSGWTAPGALQAPGVSVVNGDAGTPPEYTWTRRPMLEYELCFKCHSGYTELPAQDPDHPSRWALDKGIELNPANTSYHPVEAAGTNQSSAMAESLAGTSPYKLWNFETDETVRCLNCHGDSDMATPATPPAANSSLDNHASTNRGILIAPYRDRVLKTNAEPYLASDFALCYVCHAEAPMVDDSADDRADTNFSWHGFHLQTIAGIGTGGTDIDVPGSGRGDALCAECHFRVHGTALATGAQAQAPRLVNFAPNVRPVGGEFRFTPAGPGTLGYCTLECHNKTHRNYTYYYSGEP